MTIGMNEIAIRRGHTVDVHGASKVHKPHLDEMHGPESLPYRPDRALPKKPARDDVDGDSESRIWQPTSSREAAGLSPPPRSTGGAPGKRGGWKRR